MKPGEVLQGRYRIQREVGQGGSGRVFLATHLELGEAVAVKQMSVAVHHADLRASAQRQFQHEARILGRLRHPRLPRVHDFFQSEGTCWLVMDYVAGVTLDDHLLTRGAASEQQVLGWAAELCDVLAYLHGQAPPVVFRDLKPANIMLEDDGHLKLIDFGLSKLFAPEQGLETATVIKRAATHGFAPPEQYAGRTDPRSDLYALGATLYCLLTDSAPPRSVERVTGTATLIPLQTAAPGVSGPTARAVEAMLALDPEQRPRDALDALRMFELSPTVSSSVTPGPASGGGPGGDALPQTPRSSTARQTRAPERQVGEVLHGRYRIVRALGRGGMGAVYLATHLELSAEVAIKEMIDPFSDSGQRAAAVRQFRAEAQILHRLQHPNLPRVHDFFEADGCQYLVMDFVDGCTLDEILEREGPLPWPRLRSWALDLVDVLTYLHGREPAVVFRDLKPSNIMLDARGRLYLIDFGIAKIFDPVTGTGTQSAVRGAASPGFAALEQYSTGTDARCDIYALGATLYNLSSGVVPEQSVERACGVASLTPLRHLAPAAPEMLERAVEHMMELNRDRRPQSMGEVRRLLMQVDGPPPVEPTHAVAGGATRELPSLDLPPASSRSPRPSGWLVGAIAGLAVLAGLVGLFNGTGSRTPSALADRTRSGTPSPGSPAVPPAASAPSAAAPAPPGGVTLAPGRSFGWIRMWMPVGEATALLPGTPEIKEEWRVTGYLYRPLGLELLVRNNEVVGVAKFNRHPFLFPVGAGGVTLGASRDAVIQAYGTGYRDVVLPGGTGWIGYAEGIAFQIRDGSVSGIMVAAPAFLHER